MDGLMSKPYTKVVTYHFEAGGEHWAITDWSETTIGFEETRKNGQEDCHMAGEASLIDGKWVLDEWARENIAMYTWAKTPDEIEAYFNEHGLPEE
jgi:hypothetical protein